MNGQTGIRERNMDVERVLLIFMVIVLHYNNRAMGGALNYAMMGGSKEFFLRLSESLSICAVDAFLLLSGYFSRDTGRIPYKKAGLLICACSFYRVVGYIIFSIGISGDFSLKTLVSYIIPANWFVCMFVSVLLLSPFIIRMLSGLEMPKLREMIGIIVLLFCIVPTIAGAIADIASVDLSGLATITLNGDIDGFNVVTFVMCFCLGYYIRREKDIFDRYSAAAYFGAFLVLSLIMSLISYKSERIWSYSSIFTVLEALSLTLAFTRIKVKSIKLGNVVSAIGGCGLGIFVWHTMPLMIYGFWVHMDIPSISESSLMGYFLNFWSSTISMYALSLIWVFACRSVLRFIMNNRSRNIET